MRQVFLALGIALLLASCGGGNPFSFGHHGNAARGDAAGYAAGIKQLQSYDANKDGNVTRAEMEAGLRASFNALDTDHSGRLTPDEVRDENERRFKEDGPQYSPLIDWNQDGFIDFNEYASTMRSLFDQLDTNHDNVLTPDEMKPPPGPKLQEQKQPGQGRHRGGFRGDVSGSEF
jgi:Ca2+-binding EF-hand superfamily protein